ncbi:SH2 domain-containing protein A-like isoform X1 [Typha latifolia]|uniref:SH2 domain-containing protein A-like isoform X1 n=2 Tax=Typha latifolia TaxID=4733 RepID=UPI003C2FD771
MADEEFREEDYSKIRDLRISFDREIEGGGEDQEEGKDGFFISFWIYLSSSARPCSVILRQVTVEIQDDVPFLALSEQNKLILFPLMNLHKEAPTSGSSFSWTNMPHVSAAIECSREKWVHIGCEVAANYMRFNIDGNLVAEKHLSFLSSQHNFQEDLMKITLVGNDGNLEGYAYNIEVLHISEANKHQYGKNPPVKLSLDNSCLSDGVEEGGDGVWSIVGGKASCRRNFSLEVVLFDAFSKLVHKEIRIVASLVYADSGTPVEKSRDDEEAPLLTSCDGLEYPSPDKPVSLLRGRATFKLKMSQLSSKSDNRLFHVCFHALHDQRYPFLEAYSNPIRCISRNRNSRQSGHGKRFSSTALVLDERQSPSVNDGSGIIRDISRLGHFQIPSKLYKLDHNGSQMAVDANGIPVQDGKAFKMCSEVKSTNAEGTNSAPSDSESTDAKNSESRWSGDGTNPISDAIIFRYCLDGTYERSMLLKQTAASASDEDMANFAEQVGLYSGCSHHRNQILISKQLLQKGANIWSAISRNNNRVLWTYAIPEIIRNFMCIAHSATRGLSGQDLEVLRKIAGCGDELGREEFDRLWYWLYPVALSLSKDQINTLWVSTSPKWLEGLITREEAEKALEGPNGLKKPGTFVLRFPTSRSWPHPDAGSLVVTYVGADSVIHHKLLLGQSDSEKDSRQLQDLLLEELELSHLGRFSRQEAATCPS